MTSLIVESSEKGAGDGFSTLHEEPTGRRRTRTAHTQELTMYRAYVIEQELEKLRREHQRQQPLALELPMPLYRPAREPEPEPDEDDNDEGDETPRGVVIIDMNDYTEVES
jgi:hypothetical protein